MMGEYYYYAFCSLVGYKFSFLQFMYMIVVELQQSWEKKKFFIYHDEQLSHFFSGYLSNLESLENFKIKSYNTNTQDEKDNLSIYKTQQR